MKTSRGFTLIELLVVMAIIGVLMALLFPAVQGVINAARKAQAKNDAVQVAVAVTAYETEYGSIPSAWVNGDVDNKIMDALTAKAGNTNNKRQIVFMDVNNAKKGKSGMTNNKFVDPWNQTYQIVLDTDYDNRVDAAGETGIIKKVAVFSTGIPNKDGSANTNSSKFVKSWD